MLNMNPYYYLFYRLSRIWNKKGDNALGPIGAISIPIFVIAAFVYTKIFPIPLSSAHDPYKTGFIVIVVIILGTNLVLFLNKKRVGEIMNRYSDETVRSRRIGGFLVVLYFLIPFALIFFGS